MGDKSNLLEELKKCDEDTEICIVSNIPGRWEKYFGEWYKNKARKNISLYKSRLSPEKIAEKAEVYFCFSNHAKIVMTNNIAYIGSSNFSEESADNFESGFISKDADFIEFFLGLLKVQVNIKQMKRFCFWNWLLGKA